MSCLCSLQLDVVTLRYETNIIPSPALPTVEGDAEVNPWPFKDMSDLVNDNEDFADIVEPVVFEYLNQAGS